MKKYIIVCLLMISKILSAQDIITLHTGDEIKAKITEVGIDNIKYKKWDYQDGPEFVVAKKDIFMIKYQDGTKDVLQPAKNKELKPYGRNIFSWNPYNLAIGGNASFAYEIITKKGYAGFRLPIMFPVIPTKLNNYLAGLEVKIYPKGQGAIRGYIGNSFLCLGDTDEQFYGVGMLNGGCSFQPTKMFNITAGGALGLGTTGHGIEAAQQGKNRLDSDVFYKIDITLGLRF